MDCMCRYLFILCCLVILLTVSQVPPRKASLQLRGTQEDSRISPMRTR